MGKMVKNIKLILISGTCIAITACAPSYQMSVDEQAAYGYNQAQYGYDYVSGQSANNYGYDQAAYGYGSSQEVVTSSSSRYGNYVGGSNSLRGACVTNVQSCGMMTVLPVYPVYQVITPPQAPQRVEVPTISLPDPVPQTIEIYEPEPVYEPPVYEPPAYEPVTDYWPEPDAPIKSWAPLRK